jgi:Fe-S cluster biogenesis protein NfuA
MDALAAEGAAGEAVRDRLLADPLVESLLLLHDLHPLDTDTRVQRALDRVRPYLGSHAGGVEYLGTGPDGVARLRLEGSCHGCPSSTVTVRLAIEGAVQDAAPEVTEVVVEGMTEPPGPQLLQIGSRPPDAAAGGPPGSLLAGAAGDPGWVSLPGVGPPDGRPVAAMAGPVPDRGLLGPRHALRLLRRLRGVRLLARGRDAHRRAARLPGLRRRVRRAVGRAGAWTTRGVTWTRSRCSPTARGSGSRSRRAPRPAICPPGRRFPVDRPG